MKIDHFFPIFNIYGDDQKEISLQSNNMMIFNKITQIQSQNHQGMQQICWSPL